MQKHNIKPQTITNLETNMKKQVFKRTKIHKKLKNDYFKRTGIRDKRIFKSKKAKIKKGIRNNVNTKKYENMKIQKKKNIKIR
jgi:hypothetical protein